MLKIYNHENANEAFPVNIKDSQRYTIHRFDGFDTLVFEIDIKSEAYKYVVEEAIVEDENNRYAIKKIDEHSDFVTIQCELDLDEWKKQLFYEYRRTNINLFEVLSEIMPTGWQQFGAGSFTKRITIEGNEGTPLKVVTPFDILSKVESTFGCVFNFDTIHKKITVINPYNMPISGKFFSDELNLKSLGFNGDSSKFATRLYAYGKKDEETGVPLTFADINDGKEYVEDAGYCNKIISVGWSDERYTVKEDLLEAARKKLSELSQPERSYTCETDEFQDGIWLYQNVIIIDRRKRIRIVHQVIEYKEYPNHVGDSITLSANAPKIETDFSKIVEEIKEQISEQRDYTDFIEQSVKNATELITGNKGGHFIWVFDGEGKPQELVCLCDTEDINTAQKVWRWNASGLGYSKTGYNGNYELAILSDGSINASLITTGILNANIIRAGVIYDRTGTIPLINLETGEINLNGQVTANGNFIIKEDGSFEAVSGYIGTEQYGFKVNDNAMRHYAYVYDEETGEEIARYDYFFQAPKFQETDQTNVFAVRVSEDKGENWFYPFHVNYMGNTYVQKLGCKELGSVSSDEVLEIKNSEIKKPRIIDGELSGTTTFGPEDFRAYHSDSLLDGSGIEGDFVFRSAVNRSGYGRIGTADNPFHYVRAKEIYASGNKVTSDKKLKSHILSLAKNAKYEDEKYLKEKPKKILKELIKMLKKGFMPFSLESLELEDKSESESATDGSIDNIAEKIIYALNPASYVFNDEATLDGKIHFGFYAQEVAELLEQYFPTLDFGITTAILAGSEDDEIYDRNKHGEVDDEDLKWALSYNEFIALIVAVLQRQNERILSLEERITNLEKNGGKNK